MSENRGDDPSSPTDEGWLQEFDPGIAAEMTRLHGPPELRARKNRRYVDRLVRRHSEPVIRGLLAALSRLDRPLCASVLAEEDLDTADLVEIINPFSYMGRVLRILDIQDHDYTVEISRGHGTVGGGGQFVVTGHDGVYVVKERGLQRLC
jgi:hypothetical protein